MIHSHIEWLLLNDGVCFYLAMEFGIYKAPLQYENSEALLNHLGQRGKP